MENYILYMVPIVVLNAINMFSSLETHYFQCDGAALYILNGMIIFEQFFMCIAPILSSAHLSFILWQVRISTEPSRNIIETY